MIPQHPTWSSLTDHVSLDMGPQIISLDAIPKPNAVSAGPAVLSLSNNVVNARNYVAYWQAGSLFIRGESPDGTLWEDPVLLGSIVGVPVSISLTFDQLGRAQVFYELNGVIWLYGYDTVSQTIKSIEICPGTSPMAAMDYPADTSRATCDIILAYVINQKVEFRQQRDKYATAYPTPINNPGPNLRLTEAGFRKDRRFGITYAYDLATAPEPGNHAPYVLGTWKFKDEGGGDYWTYSEMDEATAGVVWDNGEAQVSMILGVNVEDNLPGPTTLTGHNWTVQIPNQPDWGSFAWVGVGFGQYIGLTSANQGFADIYDVFIEFVCGGVAVKVKVGFDPENGVLAYNIYLVDPDTGAVSATPVTPILFNEWRCHFDHTYNQFVTDAQVVERYSLNLWFSEIRDTWFQQSFSEYLGLYQLGEFEVNVRAIHKAGTSPDIVGYMKFTATGAP